MSEKGRGDGMESPLRVPVNNCWDEKDMFINIR